MIRLVVKVNGTYKGSDGKEYDNKQFYLQLENGNLVAVRPSFKDDYKLFSLIAEKLD